MLAEGRVLVEDSVLAEARRPLMLSAVLVDMDGLLVDSEPLWTIAETELAASLGGVWCTELKASVIGTRLDVAVPAILRWYGVEASEEAVSAATGRLLARMEELYRDAVPLRPGAAELLAELHAAGVPTALVSSSFRVLVDAVLDQMGGPLFTTSVAGDEVAHGKPHPEPYLTACARLDVSPPRCVVLEDSEAGLRSGELAGCLVVGVPDTARLTPGPSRVLVDSLHDLDVDRLRALVQASVT